MDDKTQAQLKELFDQLPPPIQRAITSADVQKELRALATTHKLHLDQWEKMENEVLMALFGLKPIEDLEKNIQTELKVSNETAIELAGDISAIVFAPIRDELERELEHPEVKEKELSGVETARANVLQEAAPGDMSASAKTQPISTASSYQMPASSPSGSSKLEARSSVTPAPSPPATVQPVTTAPVQPATPPPPPPTEKAIRMPASGAYVPGTPSTARKDVHDDPYRESPA